MQGRRNNMAKCAKCGKDIPTMGDELKNWKLYCKECGFPEIMKLVKRSERKWKV
jgi:DNA-directed RNA polymerase subunit RPC12/RpoP